MKVNAGMRFGRLTTVAEAGRAKDGHKLWLCRCDCGVEVTRQSNNLQAKAVISCRCYFSEMATTHGMRKSPTYSSWRAAKFRCMNSASKDFQNYGGRGILMCERWVNSFDEFFADMGPRPNGATLERKNVNGNYEPSNCIWATHQEQNINKRNSTYVEWRGEHCHISVAARDLGISNGAAHQRLKRGKLNDLR